jgi:hypothetical protein
MGATPAYNPGGFGPPPPKYLSIILEVCNLFERLNSHLRMLERERPSPSSKPSRNDNVPKPPECAPPKRNLPHCLHPLETLWQWIHQVGLTVWHPLLRVSAIFTALTLIILLLILLAAMMAIVCLVPLLVEVILLSLRCLKNPNVLTRGGVVFVLLAWVLAWALGSRLLSPTNSAPPL